MLIRVRHGQGSSVLEIDQDATLSDIVEKCRLAAGISTKETIEIRSGFPPKQIPLDNLEEKATVFGIRPNDQIIISSKAPMDNDTTGHAPKDKLSTFQPAHVSVSNNSKTSNQSKQAQMNKITGNDHETPSVRVSDGYLVLRVMEDDNSCLFRAVGYALMRDLDGVAELRSLVAQTVVGNTETYNEAILGRKPEEYARWINQSNSWGGAIELKIFADHFGVEIMSLDVQSGRLDRFGEGNSNIQGCVVVVYSGIHYDTIALNPQYDGVSWKPLPFLVFQN